MYTAWVCHVLGPCTSQVSFTLDASCVAFLFPSTNATSGQCQTGLVSEEWADQLFVHRIGQIDAGRTSHGHEVGVIWVFLLSSTVRAA